MPCYPFLLSKGIFTTLCKYKNNKKALTYFFVWILFKRASLFLENSNPIEKAEWLVLPVMPSLDCQFSREFSTSRAFWKFLEAFRNNEYSDSGYIWMMNHVMLVSIYQIKDNLAAFDELSVKLLCEAEMGMFGFDSKRCAVPRIFWLIHFVICCKWHMRLGLDSFCFLVERRYKLNCKVFNLNIIFYFKRKLFLNVSS